MWLRRRPVRKGRARSTRSASLGEFEHLLLLTVLRLGADAYGLEIAKELASYFNAMSMRLVSGRAFDGRDERLTTALRGNNAWCAVLGK